MKKTILTARALLLLALFFVSACSKSEREGKVNVTFEVEAENLRDGESVYITGNRPELGDWQAGSVMMEPVNDMLWRIELAIPYGARLEYKFTLGSWEREGIHEDGGNMENFKLAAVHSKTYQHRVVRWKSEGIPSEFVTGTVKYHIAVGGENLVPRHIIVWLPPGYETGNDRYPVLYAHDGQNLFDPYTSFLGTDWGVDEALTELIESGACEPVIAVGIYNTQDRSAEYSMTEKGEAYQRFVVDVVKPLIDSTYRTKPEREHTATMGSSLGGLVSFLLAWNYPETFQQAACLSPAFFTNAVELVRQANAMPEGMRIYMDNGTIDLEKELQIMCDDMMSALAEKGYKPGHQDFKWFLDEGAEHNEAAWSARVDRPLLFMFGKDRPPASNP